uniref:Uncharacterized protein n=1 Tax=Parascaris univalens TaxID=6257 RepID=A0A915A0K9_PARUN
MEPVSIRWQGMSLSPYLHATSQLQLNENDSDMKRHLFVMNALSN